jgi:hypothetical protein
MVRALGPVGADLHRLAPAGGAILLGQADGSGETFPLHPWAAWCDWCDTVGYGSTSEEAARALLMELRARIEREAQAITFGPNPWRFGCWPPVR